MKKITTADAIARLNKEILRAGGVRPLAREWGIFPSVISDTRHGKRPISPVILHELGLEWVLIET